MLRVTAVWTGFLGAPGYSNFYFAGPGETAAAAQAAANDVRLFFESIRGSLPSTVQVTVQPTVGVINPEDGVLTDELAVTTPPAVVQGSGTQAYAVVAGMVVNWRTSTIVNGRRLRGRTFLVPIQGGAYEGNGTPSPGALTEVRNAATVLATVNTGAPVELVVWHRPRNVAAPGAPTDLQGGSTAVVTSASVPDKPAVLRSRRD